MTIYFRKKGLIKKIMAKQIYAKDPSKYIPALASALKDLPEFEVPEWAEYVKTGISRKRPPMDDGFWFVRAASVLRQLYIQGVVGVGKLRTRYGSRKERGGRPEHFKKAGGKIIRVILQQAELAGLVEIISGAQHGRRLTIKGKEFLDSIEVENPEELNFDNVTVDVNLSTGQEYYDNVEEETLEENVEVIEEDKDGK